MTERADIDALVTELRECVSRGSYSGGGYQYVEVAPEDATAVADALESTAAELRKERERADEAERQASEITTAWLDKERQIAAVEADLARAREVIENSMHHARIAERVRGVEPSDAQVARYLLDRGHYVPEDLRPALEGGSRG